MNIKLNTAFVLLLSGKGERLFNEIHIKKQFFLLDGIKLYLYPLISALNSKIFSKIILVVDKDDVSEVSSDIKFLDKNHEIIITIGGKTRNESVYAGLKALNDACITKVIIHDAARPFLDVLTLREIHSALQDVQALTCYLPIYDSLFDSEKNEYLNRNNKALIYTPQGFDYQLIKSIYEKDFDASSTDDFSKVLKRGVTTKMLAVKPWLFKITDSNSLKMAECFVKPFKEYIAKIIS